MDINVKDASNTLSNGTASDFPMDGLGKAGEVANIVVFWTGIPFIITIWLMIMCHLRPVVSVR